MNKRIKQTLICGLTEKERNEYGIQLATRLGDMEEMETEKKRNADHFKDRIAGLQGACDELSRKVRDGKEWRDVECEVLLGSPDREHKQTIRLDTGETIKTERMTEADLQTLLPLDTEADEDRSPIDNLTDAMETGDSIDVSVSYKQNEPTAAGGVEIVDELEEAHEHIELLQNIDLVKGVAKRTALIEEFIASFGDGQIALVVEIGKRNGFDEKKLAHLAGFIPAATEEENQASTDY